MVNDSRSGHKAKDDERNNSTKKLLTGKGSSTSGSGTTNIFELRRSTRETPSKKQMTSSPSSGSITRKSVRLEKRAPTTPPLETKPEGIEKLTPLRRSDRGKKQTSSSSSGSKKSEKESSSMNSKQTKGKTGKIVRRLTVESPEVSRSSREDAKSVGRKRKRMTARKFKALFKTHVRKDNVVDDDEVEGSDKSSQVESDSGGDSGSEHMDSRENDSNESSEQIGEESREEYVARSSEEGLKRSNSVLRNSANETLRNNVEVELSDSSDKHSEPYKPSDPDSIEASKEEKLRDPQVVDSALVGNSSSGGIAIRISDKGIQYKRKRSKIGNQNNDEAAKRLKSVPALNNSIDVESSETRRDHDSQKEDPRSHNNTTLNKDSFDSPIPKVYDSMKYSRVKFSSGKTWRDREVHVLDDSPEKSEDENVGGKQHKTVVARSDPPTLKPGVEGVTSSVGILNTNNHSFKTLSPTANMLLPDVCTIEPEERATLSIEQTSFQLLLKRKISRLSDVLKLSEDLKAMALRFLEYVTENHHVTKEPGTILQAFVISMCWIAASLLKQKIDRKQSLSLAKQYMNFTCKEEEAESVYSKLRLLKKIFLQKIQVPLDVRASESPNNKPTNDKMTNGIKSPRRKCDERMATLLQNQQEEIQNFHRIWDEKRVALEKDRKLESAFIHSTHSHIPVRRDRLKILDGEFAKKMEEHKRQKEIGLKDLQAKQLGERNDERLKGTHLLAEAESPASAAKVPSGTPNLVVDLRFQAVEAATVVSEKESTAPIERPNITVDSSDLSKSEEILSEPPEAVASEVVEGFGSVETVDPAVESDQENGRTDEIGSDTPNSTANKNDDVNSSVNRASPSAELLSLPGDCGQTDQSNHEAEPLEQIQQPSRLPLPSGLTHEPRAEGEIPSQNIVAAVAHQLAEGPTVVSAQAVLQTREDSELNSLTNSTKIPLGHNQPDSVDHLPVTEPRSVVGPTEPQVVAVTQSIANLEVHPSVDDNQHHVCSTGGVRLNPEAIHQMFDETTELPNQTSLQSGANVASTQGFNNFPLFMEPQLTSRMATLPLYTDPLQNELDSIRRVKDHAAKVHEDAKMRIKFECDKEIEETVARIRRKHEDKLRETEAAYLANKIEMEANYNRVFMNRLLAHAFRTKCVGPGTSGPLGMDNVAPSSSMQQHRQTSLPPAPRPSFVTATPSTSQPSASHQAVPPPPPPPPPQILQQPPPPLPPQILQQSAALLSSMPTRPPNINNITPSTGNHRGGGGGEFRAPAPHLQRFRPTSMSSTSLISLQRVMPSHQVPINLLVTSHSSSQTPPRPPQPSSAAPSPPPLPASAPPPPQPPFLTNHSRHINNSVPSALQLLLDIDNRSSASGPNLLPPLNISSFNLPDTGMAGNPQVSSSPSPVLTDIVCLSDED